MEQKQIFNPHFFVIPAIFKRGSTLKDSRHFRRRTSSSSRKALRALARALKHSGMTVLLFILSLCVSSINLHAAVVGKTVEYQDGKDILEGYLVYDDATQDKRPAVLVVHAWEGLDDYTKSRAEQLAQLGYVAFAVDMYGKGIRAKDHDDAAKLSGVYRSDRALMRRRAKAGYDFLKSHALTDPERMAAIGYCFGGTTVLEMARAGFDLKGVASFHGDLSTSTPAKPGDIRAKVIAFQGGNDQFTLGGADNFENEMRQAGADWQLVVLGGAVHSFTVPTAGTNEASGMAYNEKADRRSWAILLQFFSEIFE